MESKYLYLIINLAALSIPFAASFYPRAPFVRHWRHVLPAITLTAVVFIAWDIRFTHSGIWGFNDQYLIGVSVGGLPVEEILFFFCIPYACLFTYFALNQLIKTDILFRARVHISAVLAAILLTTGAYHVDKLYTSVTFLITAVVLVWLGLKRRAHYLGRFYFAFILLLIPFFLVNGALTGFFTPQPVVWYNDAENLGIRLATIPLEDMVYSLLLLLVPVALWEGWRDGKVEK